jgi:hypothetical protein
MSSINISLSAAFASKAARYSGSRFRSRGFAAAWMISGRTGWMVLAIISWTFLNLAVGPCLARYRLIASTRS